MAALAIAGALAYLIALAVGAGGAYYLTIPEAQERAQALQGKAVRAQGIVDGASIRWDMSDMRLAFTIRDESDPGRTLAVTYRGARPDGLEDGRAVIVEGKVSPDGSALEATTLMVQCPSRYEAEVSKLGRAGNTAR